MGQPKAVQGRRRRRTPKENTKYTLHASITKKSQNSSDNLQGSRCRAVSLLAVPAYTLNFKAFPTSCDLYTFRQQSRSERGTGPSLAIRRVAVRNDARGNRNLIWHPR